MKLLSPVRIGLCALVVFAGLLTAVLAQTTPDTSDSAPALTTGLARKNVQGSSIATRAPGKMVNAGMAKLQEVAPLPPVTITETEQPGPFDLFMAGAVEMILKAIQDLLLYFQDLFFERAGLPPVDSNTNGNDNSNTNGNTNDNDNTNGNTNENDNGNTNANSNVNNNQNDNTSGTGRPGGVRKPNR